MKFIIKKSLIIVTLIVTFLFSNNSYSTQNNYEDYGIISIMYHRFDENKYPSTNIRMNNFKEQIDAIRKEGLSFINPKNFKDELVNNKKKRKILITIDDAFLSFYQNAWPFLKKNKIPFILFVSTKDVGNFNYMNWNQINELSKENFVHIGNHSHTHEYLIDLPANYIREDIIKSMAILEKKTGYKTKFFSYPFGEYSSVFKTIIKELGFDYAFGQHSGVIDESKDLFELPRFPINEKYGKLERFETLLKTLPFKYKNILPIEKYINNKNNPPKVSIEFYENIKNLNLINCYSNEENEWRKSEIKFAEKSVMKVILKGKFITERGRINCSLNAGNGFWRWLGIQFVIAEK